MAWMTLEILMVSPLVSGGDMTRLDELTLNVLGNDEVTAADLDSPGRQAVPSAEAGDVVVRAKDLEGGATAVGLFNRGEQEAEVAARWSDPSLQGLLEDRPKPLPSSNLRGGSGY